MEVTPVELSRLSSKESSENSHSIRRRVVAARQIQLERFSENDIHANAQMTTRQSREFCLLDGVCSKLLLTAMDKLSLSARAYDRILKVSRTIADLAGAKTITEDHLAEAIQYRSLDREGWGG